MAQNTKILVTAERVLDTEHYDSVFVIEDALKEAGAAGFDNLFTHFANTDLKSGTQLPLYELLWPHLVRSNSNYGFLFELLIVYDLLNQYISKHSVEVVEYRKLDYKYISLLRDIQKNSEVSVRRVGDHPLIFFKYIYHNLRTFLLLSQSLFIVLADQIIGIVLSSISGKKLKNPRVVVFPYPGRFGSLLPVLDKMETRPSVVLPHFTIAWHRINESVSIGDYNPLLYSSFASYTSITNTIRIYFALLIELYVNRHLEGSIQNQLYDQEDVPKNIINYSVTKVIGFNGRALLSAPLVEGALSILDPDRVVVGGAHPRDRTVLFTARMLGITKRYYVPHSIVDRYEFVPDSRTIQFVEGDIAEKHIRKYYDEARAPQLCVTGRPYLQEINKFAPPSRGDNVPRLMLATQPFSTSKRTAFVRHVIEAASESPIEWDIVIKIHPSETADIYNRLYQDINKYDIRGITVEENNLVECIVNSTLVITINSNVGLESIVLGTPCIALNEWSPMISIKPHLAYSPVPVLTSKAEIIEYFDRITWNHISELTDRQLEFLKKHYKLDSMAGKVIADCIEE